MAVGEDLYVMSPWNLSKTLGELKLVNSLLTNFNCTMVK